MNELWTEKYRPKTIEEYVFTDDIQKRKVSAWIKSGALPHVLLTGSAGVGKTTLAKMLMIALDVDEGDIMFINASKENNVDTMRTKIDGFASTIPFGGDYKYVIFDEADLLSFSSQGVLRNMLETYSNTCRFIFTANYPDKIMPAIHSRCQGFHINKLDTTEFTVRVATILLNENIEFTPDDLDVYVKTTYPDMRKCINLLQQNSFDMKLHLLSDGEHGESDWVLEYVAMFQIGKVADARKLIVEKAKPEEYVSVYRKLYENLEWFGEDINTQGRALLCIRDGLVNHSIVADPEINLSATLLELQYITGEK